MKIAIDMDNTIIDEIENAGNQGKTGILLEPYRKNKKMDENELMEISKRYKL